MAVHMPDVGNTFFLQKGMHTLADADQVILVAAPQPEQFEVARFGRVWDELLRRFGVGRGGKAAYPGKRVKVSQTEIERLAAAHGEPRQRTMFAIGLN